MMALDSGNLSIPQRHAPGLNGFVVAIAAWSAILIAISITTERIEVGGIVEYSTLRVFWGMLVPAALSLIAAVILLTRVRSATFESKRRLLIFMAIAGLVGLVGTALSLIALIRLGRGRGQLN